MDNMKHCYQGETLTPTAGVASLCDQQQTVTPPSQRSEPSQQDAVTRGLPHGEEGAAVQQPGAPCSELEDATVTSARNLVESGTVPPVATQTELSTAEAREHLVRRDRSLVEAYAGLWGAEVSVIFASAAFTWQACQKMLLQEATRFDDSFPERGII
jgi:hypothetical protein